MRSIQDIDPHYHVDWYRVPISPERLQELNQRSDLKGFLQTGGYLGMILLSGGAVAWTASMHLWGWMSLSLFSYCAVSSFNLNAIHELVHGTVFKTKPLNSFFAALFSLHGWSNHHAFWASHAEHHKFTLHNPEDSEVLVPITMEWDQIWRRLTFHHVPFVWFLGSTIKLACGNPISEWGAHLYSTPERRNKIYGWARVQLLVHSSLLLPALFNGWWIIPVLQFTPMFISGAIQFFLNESQHVGLQDHVNDFRLNTRTFYTNPLFRLLYWQMNYHIEHHMYSGVPCYNLRKLHEEIKHELPYTFKSVIETWHHIIYCLYRQKTQPGYVYIPVIPGGENPQEVSTESAKKEPTQAPSQTTRPNRLNGGGIPFKAWECTVCGFIYDEEIGLPKEGIDPGTRWSDIPEDWRCPDCGVAKADFAMREVARPQNLERLPSTVDVGDRAPIIVIGSGYAAITLAKEFRKLNKTKQLLLLTQNNGDIYYKPNLSTALASGKTAECLVLSSAKDMATELNITIITEQEVLAVDPRKKTIHLKEQTFTYSRLVFATGASPTPLPFEHLLQINNLEDYRVFRQQLPTAKTVAILGAGLIGCELANDLLTQGIEVTLIDPSQRPLARIATKEQSEGLTQAFSKLGATWHLGSKVKTILNGTSLELENGSLLHADLILSAVGVQPRTQLAQTAGCETQQGICVDKILQTSVEHIYAIGDCMELEGNSRPYIKPIQFAAVALAKTLAGTKTEVVFPEMPIVVKTPAFPLTIYQTTPQNM